MKKKPSSQLAFSNLRGLIALALCGAGRLLPVFVVGLYPSPAAFAQAAQQNQSLAERGIAKPHTAVGPTHAQVPELTLEQLKAAAAELDEINPLPPLRGERRNAPPANPPTKPALNTAFSSTDNPSSGPKAPNDFTYRTVHDLTASEASNNRLVIGEASTANMGSTVFYAGNSYAAYSANGGQSFNYVSPYNTFPSANNGFCCDQVVNYAPNQDMMIWALLYNRDATSNTVRIARAVGSSAVANNTWSYYDFKPQGTQGGFQFPANRWLDFPNLTVSDNYLYATANVYDTVVGCPLCQFRGSVIWRISLSQLAAGGAINYDYFIRTDVDSLRCTEGAHTSIYWGALLSTTQVRIHRWDDSSGSVFWDDVNINSFNPLNRDGLAMSPDGSNWAARADSRILGAWVSNNVIGLMWSAKQGGSFPYPYTIVARFNQSNRALLSQTAIYNNQFAWLYPTASVNAAGNLSGLLSYGGGPYYPGANLWISDDVENGFSPLAVHNATSSNVGPGSDAWGDYQTVRRHKGSPNTWVASTHYVQNSGSNVVPRFLWIGRERDFPASSPTPSPTATPVTETINAPGVAGPPNGTVGVSNTYTAGGSSSNLGHTVQYQFDWGDGDTSAWLSVGVFSASHSWSSGGNYNVKARARCATHTSIMSSYSSSLSVSISMPTATPTATATATATATPTATATATATAAPFTPPPTPTPIATATPAPTATPSAELLTNGGFESGNLSADDWAFTGSSGGSGTGVTFPHSGSKYAYLGANNDAWGQVIHDFTSIPSNVTVTLGFWLNVISDETGFGTNDTMVVSLLDDNGTHQLASFSEADRGASYGFHSYDVSPYRGQSVRIEFDASTNASLPTTFRIDDVSLQAFTAPTLTPTPTPSVTPTQTPIATPSGTPTASPTSTPNLIVNGSFELPGVVSGNFGPGRQQYLAGSQISGWTIGGTGDVFLHKCPEFGAATYCSAQDASFYLDLSGSQMSHATVYQDFSTTPGSTYQLSFYIGASNQVPPSPTIEIKVIEVSSGSALLNTTLIPVSPGAGINWTLQTFGFVAGSSPTRVEFVDTSTFDDNASFVDNVSVVPAAPIIISGTISYCSNPIPGPVPDVTLNLSGGSNASTRSNGPGNYQFSSLVSGGSYTITPSKTALPTGTGNITGVDAVAVQRHFLILGTPLTGCQLTAADVTGTPGVVDGVDAVAIQRFFLGLTSGLGNVGKYKFTPANRAYPGVTSDQTGQNYDTLVLGDVAAPFAEPTPTPPALIQWPVSAGGNGHFYEFVTSQSPISWTAARDAAIVRGGYLATVTSGAENAFVAGLGNTDIRWIGGYQPSGSPEPAGGWSWVTGEPFTYASWYSGEPNNGGGGAEDYIIMWGSSWVDAANLESGGWSTTHYVAEYDALPMRAGEVSATVESVALPEVAIDQVNRNFVGAVRTADIDAKNKLVGFQGDLTYDERVVTFQNPPVSNAGLTAGNWNVSGNVLLGMGPIRTLRISAFSNDFTPLSGSGTLFELRMTSVGKAAQSTQLLWAAPPDDFIFIDADLKTQKPRDAVAGNVKSLNR